MQPDILNALLDAVEAIAAVTDLPVVFPIEFESFPRKTTE